MKRFNIMTAKAYTKKDGNSANKWVKIGSSVLTDDGKMYGDIDCIPLGNWFDGSIQFFEVEQQSQSNHQGNYNQPQHNQQSNHYNTYNTPGNQRGY